jgi:hypothetical protein
MAQERLVIRNPLVWMAPAATPTTFAACEGFVKKITIKPKRGKVDTKGYSDGGQRNEKLDAEHEAELEFFHSRAWSEFSALLVTELNADDPTGFRVKYRGAVAAGADNRVFQFKVQLTDLGSLGGEKNTASMASMTLPIEGKVQSSTDGTTFTDYF